MDGISSDLDRLIREIESRGAEEAGAEAILESVRAFSGDPRLAQCLSRIPGREASLRMFYIKTCMLYRLKDLRDRRLAPSVPPTCAANGDCA